MPAKGWQKKFCINGHDISIVGRDNSGHCSLCVLDIKRKHYQTHKDMWQKYYQDNKEQIAAKKKIYNKNNIEKFRKPRLDYYNMKYRLDPEFKIKCRLRHRLRMAIKNDQKVGSAVKDLGCSIAFLKQYIQVKFYANMTWDNHGKVWELDHIVPLSRFDLTDREQFLKAVHYTNLQPLTIKDNRNKGMS